MNSVWMRTISQAAPGAHNELQESADGGSRHVPLLKRLTCRWQAWRQDRRLLAQLGSESAADQERARACLMARGEAAIPLLYRALRGSFRLACSAAVALYRLGDGQGVRAVLERCYEEEWLIRSVRDGYLERDSYEEGVRALQQLDREAVGAALHAALDAAAREREVPGCLGELALALSALRVLLLLPGKSPCAWWELAIHYGGQSLSGLRRGTKGILPRSLTHYLRWEAVRGLLTEHRTASFSILARALESEDFSVVHTAILGLRRLGDPRALPGLQSIAFAPGHPLAIEARSAIEALAGSLSEPLVLLRAAEPEAGPEELLRPAEPVPRWGAEVQILMRPLT